MRQLPGSDPIGRDEQVVLETGSSSTAIDLATFRNATVPAVLRPTDAGSPAFLFPPLVD